MSSLNRKRKRNSSLRGDSTRRLRLVQIARQRNDSVQTEKTKDTTTGFYVTVGDRCINMLCWVSKGISLFFVFFFFFFFLLFFKRYFQKPLLRFAGMSQESILRYRGVDWRAEATTTVWHIQGFFFSYHLTTTLTRKTHSTKQKTQQQSILKIALVLPFLCFSPNHTDNSQSNYCGNIVKCYLTSFSLPRSLS